MAAPVLGCLPVHGGSRRKAEHFGDGEGVIYDVNGGNSFTAEGCDCRRSRLFRSASQ